MHRTMSTLSLFGAALLLLGAAHGLQAQQGPGGGRGGRGMMRMNPVSALLDAKADLGLSDDQVTRLTALSDSLDQTLTPLRQKMMEARSSGGGREAMQPIMQEVRSANQKAMSTALGILDPAQRQKAQDLLKSRRPMRGGGPGPNGGPR